MKTNTIKSTIVDRFNFDSVKGAADVKATIRGQEYKVVIKKGEAQKVISNRKSIWTPEAGTDILSFLDNLVHPETEKKTDIVKDTKKPVTKKPVTKKTAAKKTDKKTDTPKPSKEKVVRNVVDDKWIAHLTEEANKSDRLDKGDTIQFRVATSKGRPVCAHVDLHREGLKVSTAGIHHRVGFATKGVDAKWRTQIDTAIKVMYKKLGNDVYIQNDDSSIKMRDQKVVDATGSIKGLRSLIDEIEKNQKKAAEKK